MLSFFAQLYKMLILIIAQMEGPLSSDDFTDFLNIVMDATDDYNELNKYLSQPLEKVHDLTAWWWKHQAMFPTLSAMAFSYLSTPGMSLFI
jgi:hypothetical protein